ncbi:MAG: hypothetical protein ACOX8R_09045 [Bacillota bacterium]
MSSFNDWKARKKEEYDARWEAQEELMEEMRKGEEYELNEKGLIKRKGFGMRNGTANYGYQFEKEHFDDVFKKSIVLLIGLVVVAVIVFVFAIHYVFSHPEAPGWLQTVVQK